MRSVELRQLLAFAGVARHLNFTRAAAELGIQRSEDRGLTRAR
jgi:DNA-binding transcriptional LysR family regulator